MMIASVVIDTHPGDAEQAAAALQGRPGIPIVRGPVSPNRLVAVLEAEDPRAMEGLVDQIMATDGIVHVSPAYVRFDA